MSVSSEKKDTVLFWSLPYKKISYLNHSFYSPLHIFILLPFFDDILSYNLPIVVTVYCFTYFRFSINFMNGTDADSDIAMHFNPRISEGQVVMNTCNGGDWGEEERADIPSVIAERKPFEIKIVTKRNKFKVNIMLYLLTKEIIMRFANLLQNAKQCPLKLTIMAFRFCNGS